MLTNSERDALALQYQPLAHYVLRRYAPRSVWRLAEDYDDLLGAIMLGIVKASRTYDPELHPGVSFKTHATWQARAALSRFMDARRRDGFRFYPERGGKRVTNSMMQDNEVLHFVEHQRAPDPEPRIDWTDAQWRHMLRRLPRRERRIVWLLYRDEMDVRRVARRFHITRQRVFEIARQAFDTLRTTPEVRQAAA